MNQLLFVYLILFQIDGNSVSFILSYGRWNYLYICPFVVDDTYLIFILFWQMLHYVLAVTYSWITIMCVLPLQLRLRRVVSIHFYMIISQLNDSLSFDFYDDKAIYLSLICLHTAFAFHTSHEACESPFITLILMMHIFIPYHRCSSQLIFAAHLKLCVFKIGANQILSKFIVQSLGNINFFSSQDKGHLTLHKKLK